MPNSETDLVFACWVYDKNKYTIVLAGGSVGWSVIIGSILGQGTYGRHLIHVSLRGKESVKNPSISS